MGLWVILNLFSEFKRRGPCVVHDDVQYKKYGKTEQVLCYWMILYLKWLLMANQPRLRLRCVQCSSYFRGRETKKPQRASLQIGKPSVDCISYKKEGSYVQYSVVTLKLLSGLCTLAGHWADEVLWQRTVAEERWFSAHFFLMVLWAEGAPLIPSYVWDLLRNLFPLQFFSIFPFIFALTLEA